MDKWQMNRTGLFNYWYYEEEAFEFSGGKLLLRGNNGAGKSVTMQSFLPVLLDGRTSPERLDPFGSRARRMEDYLLGEKEISGLDERTGYLFMEFKRQQTDQYVTIGIGMQARRGKQLKFWGFVVTDNRRLGIDLPLYKEERHEGEIRKLPLSKIELKNRLGDGGQVVDSKKEYAALVNQYIFGYETMEEYEDLIKLLIQLRSPKLSKEFRPTVIYEILEEALPPLSDEDLRHLSDTIEQMDQTKQQIEQLDREAEAISQINQSYTAYNERLLLNQASGYINASETYEKSEKDYQRVLGDISQLKQEINQLTNEINDHSVEKEAKRKQEDRLRQHKVWNLENERQEKEDKKDQTQNRLNSVENRVADTRKKEGRLRDSLEKMELNLYHKKKELMEDLDDLEADAFETSFNETHKIHQEDFEDNIEHSFSFGAWLMQSEKQGEHLEQATEKLRKLEELKKTFQEKDRELGSLSQELDEQRNQERDWRTWFDEEKNTLKNRIYQWREEVDWLEISDENLRQASRKMDLLYDEERYESVIKPIRKSVDEFVSLKHKHIAEYDVQLKNVTDNMVEIETELDEWRKKKDPDPGTQTATKDARLKLKKQGTVFTPLYSAVEFKEGVDQQTQLAIESALYDTRLLDALIMKEGNELKLKHDRILKPNPQLMAYTLADLLKPDLPEGHEISNQVVDDILRSIIIDESNEEALSISEDGHYSIGVLKGHALPISNVRFIGRNARKRYRGEQIEGLKEEWLALNQEKMDAENKKETCFQQIERTYDQFDQFPHDEDLAEGWKQLEHVQIIIDQFTNRLETLSVEVKKLNEEARKVKFETEQLTKKDQLRLNYESYQHAVSVMRRYEKECAELQRKHSLYLNESKRKKDTVELLDEVEEDLIQLKSDVSLHETDVSQLTQELSHIKQQMEKEGVHDIRHQIKEVQDSLRVLDTILEEKNNKKIVQSTELKHKEETIEMTKDELDFWEKMHKAWSASFGAEVKRELANNEKQEDLKALAYSISNQFSETYKNKEINQLSSRLSRIVNEKRDTLIENSLLQRTVQVDIPEWMNESKSNDPYINEWKNQRSRELIELTLQGQQVSPYTVQEDLEKERTRQQIYLDEQDKELYEEILFQSVGNKLRARITRAEKWVEEMKALLESRNDSSGLTLSIRWKPRTAEAEEEIDTKELVQLLRQDARLLKEEDIDRITTHFRTKIERAKGLMDEDKELQTLLQVLKQVLDYRHWFSFELSFQREGDTRKRPLTNNQFDKFSGGEKARAMYIPLFIATYSRYQEASPDAPYIISLDEAFAGVDEQNIRDLFEVVEELGFNYIMNSQALWGDYDTISELAISELYRPRNADYVSVIRYLWDGEKRQLITD